MKSSKVALSLLLYTLASSSVLRAEMCAELFNDAPTTEAHARLSSKKINKLLELSLKAGPSQLTARQQLQSALGLNDLNFVYYLSLFEKFKSPQKTGALKIYPELDSRLVAYPIASSVLPADLNLNFKSHDYSQLKNEFTGEYSRNSVLLIKKLQAGTGSSMTRQSYFDQRKDIATILGLAPGTSMVLGAKGTDLLVQIPHPLKPSERVEISIAELQILQAWEMAKKGQYSQVILQDIVGPETQNRLNAVWQKKSLIDPHQTYAQLFSGHNEVGRLGSVFQSHVPALTEDQQISFNRMAPAGHGLFAVDALRAVLHPELLPKTPGKTLIGAIANGEDLNSLPDPVMVDWMIKNKVAIVLITTQKSSIDKKGGLLTMVVDSESGEKYLKVIDTAEAKSAGQLDHFESVDGIVSTNLTLFNYEVLNEKIRRIPEAELLRIITPDLIPNWKQQKDKDGVTRKYLQLEGTMGSTILNLDRYYRKTYGEGLVSIVNIDEASRTDFFSPIKSAFDYFMQFHSDLYQINPVNLKLKFKGPKSLPSFSLKDPSTNDQYYADVQNVLDSFQSTSVRELTDLNVVGQINASHAIFKGRVSLINETHRRLTLEEIFNRLPKAPDGRALIKDSEIRFTASGEVKITALAEKGYGIAYARVATSGSHTDYNKGLTMAALLPVKTETRVTPRQDDIVNIRSGDKSSSFQLGSEKREGQWSDYIQGVSFVLRSHGFHISGFDAKIESTIPFGAGISSSAALVTSVFKALRSAYDLPIDNLLIAKMGQQVEHFVGANTGLLDQMTISLLDQDTDSALMINFAEMSYKKVKMPADAEFVIIHTGLTHSLTDTHGTRNYATRRAQCEEAAKILGVPNLSVLSTKALEARQSELPPILYRRAHHVVSENERVKAFAYYASVNDLADMGRIMNESHLSQKNDYDISETPIDKMVEILQRTPGVYGAQLTGGGFGGAVVFLAKKGEGRKLAEKIMPEYQSSSVNRGQFKPYIIAPVSPN